VRRPRCIFTDLDGTLFGTDSQLSSRTIGVLRAADAAGVAVVAATGRSHRTTTARLSPAGVVRWALCSNGAVRFDLHAGYPVCVTTLDKPTIAALVDGVRSAAPEAAFGWETIDGFGFEPEFSHPPETFDRGGGPGSLGEVEAAVKIYIGHPRLTDVSLQRAMSDHIPDGIVAATSGAPFIEATAATANKGAAAASLVADLGMSADECVAIGDQMNDMSLLAWAGHSIAMSNAHPDVLAIADEVAGHHAEDGAAIAIEGLLALPARDRDQ
jgi:hydroxymethylpyrimidine pyrophosphatase-like HAD family hydrolase